MKRFSVKLSYASNYIRINVVCFKPYPVKLSFVLNHIRFKRNWNKTIFNSNHIPFEDWIEISENLQLRHGVVAVTSPRMTTQNALHSKIHPFDRTVFAQGFNSILRTSWGETARGWGVHRNETLIKPNGKNE